MTTRPLLLPHPAVTVCERRPGAPPCRRNARALAGCSAQGGQPGASFQPNHAPRSGGGQTAHTRRVGGGAAPEAATGDPADAWQQILFNMDRKKKGPGGYA